MSGHLGHPVLATSQSSRTLATASRLFQLAVSRGHMSTMVKGHFWAHDQTGVNTGEFLAQEVPNTLKDGSGGGCGRRESARPNRQGTPKEQAGGVKGFLLRALDLTKRPQ